MSQSSIFRKLSESSIAQSSRKPLCSKMRKIGFLTSLTQWITNPNPTSSTNQQSIPLGISTPSSVLSRPAAAMTRQGGTPPSSSLTSQKIVANNPYPSVSINILPERRLWTLFGVHGGRKTLEPGQICTDSSGSGFLKNLRKTYRDLRGFWRVWFSFWQFSHCDFVKVIRPFSQVTFYSCSCPF